MIASCPGRHVPYAVRPEHALGARLLVREAGPAEAPKPRLLDRVRRAIETRHYSRRTEKAYVHWIKRYIFFHGKRHPAEMGAAEVAAFLTSLAAESKVAASTQNQALSALLFLYREVLGIELPWLDDVVRAKRPLHLPVVLTRDEVCAVLQRLDGVPRLMAVLLYGAGLRLLECCRLRVKDVDFATSQITIRDGKGHKDRATMLPAAVKAGFIVVLTSRWPSSSWTVRISWPSSSRWVANECRKVWHVAGLAIPALRTASFTARWRTDSWRWWRRRWPVTRST
jgi:integrase